MGELTYIGGPGRAPTLRERIALRLLGLRSTQADKDFFKTAARAGVMNTSEPMTDPFAQHPVINACIRAITDNLASVPFGIYTAANAKTARGRNEFNRRRFALDRNGHSHARAMQRDAEFVPVEDNSNKLVHLFEAPDPRLGSATLFWDLTVKYLLTDGECCTIAQGRDNVADVPDELWPRSGNDFRLIDTQNGMPTLWGQNSGGKELQDYQLVRPRIPDPKNPLRGVAPWKAGQVGTETDWYALLYNRNFFQNGTTLGGIVMVAPGTTQPQRDGIKASMEQKHGGVDNAFSIGVLAGATDFKEFGTNPKDMQFVTQRKYAREEIAMLFRVPLTVLSVYEQVNYANARVQDKAFWRMAIVPLIRYLEDIYYAQLFRWVEGGRYWGAFDLSQVESLQEDFAEKLGNAKALKDLGYDLNQINARLNLGMEDVAWGNVAWMPAGLTPADVLLEEANNPPEPAAPPALPSPVSAAGAPVGDKAKEHGGGDATLDPSRGNDVLAPALGVLPKAPAVRRIKPSKADTWTSWVRLLTPFERRFGKTYKTYLFKLRREQLATLAARADRNLAQGRAPDAIVADELAANLLFARKEWDARLAQVTRPIYGDIMMASASEASKSIGGNMLFNLTDPAVVAAMNDKELKIIETNTTLRDNLKAQLSQGIAQGETTAQLQDRVRQVFNFQESRALTIARTETGECAGYARHESMIAEGVGGHGWLTAMDEQVRESHAEAEAEGIIPITEAFKATGCMYPGDWNGDAGEIINCRCVEVIDDTVSISPGAGGGADEEPGTVQNTGDIESRPSPKEYFDGLDIAEQNSLYESLDNWISGGMYPDMRQMDRGEALSIKPSFIPIVERDLNNLRSLMAATNGGFESEYLYRGMNLSGKAWDAYKDQAAVGNVMTLDCLSSFSTSRKVAGEFMEVGYERSVLIKISQPRTGCYVSNLYDSGPPGVKIKGPPSQHEVLVPKGTTYRVTGVSTKGSVTTIELEEINGRSGKGRPFDERAGTKPPKDRRKIGRFIDTDKDISLRVTAKA